MESEEEDFSSLSIGDRVRLHPAPLRGHSRGALLGSLSAAAPFSAATEPTGVVAYLGETKFAGGEWAGVVLDAEFVAAFGKNDGEVKGMRYFQTEPKRGIFTRVFRLSKIIDSTTTTTTRPEKSDSNSSEEVDVVVEDQDDDNKDKDEVVKDTEEDEVEVEDVTLVADEIQNCDDEENDNNADVGSGSADSGIGSAQISTNPESSRQETTTPIGPESPTNRECRNPPKENPPMEPSYARSTVASKDKQREAIGTGRKFSGEERGRTGKRSEGSEGGEGVSASGEDDKGVEIEGEVDGDQEGGEEDLGEREERIQKRSEYGIVVGDRVMVSRTRVGYVRFIGATDFAHGIWVGVELDEPKGKNNGVVAGKKYFNCKGPFYGIFSPLAKVVKIDAAGRKIGAGKSASSRRKEAALNGGTESERWDLPYPSLRRSSSRDSLASISSMSSISSVLSQVSLGGGGGGTATKRTSSYSYAAAARGGIYNSCGGSRGGGGAASNDAASGTKSNRKGAMVVKPLVPNGKTSVDGKSGNRNSTNQHQYSGNQNQTSANHHSVNSKFSKDSATQPRNPEKSKSDESLRPKKSSDGSVKRSPAFPGEDATHRALRDALEEKTQHVDQLLKERDLERAEAADRVAAAEENETELNLLKAEATRFRECAEEETELLSRKLSTAERETREWRDKFEARVAEMEDLRRKVDGKVERPFEDRVEGKEEAKVVVVEAGGGGEDKDGDSIVGEIDDLCTKMRDMGFEGQNGDDSVESLTDSPSPVDCNESAEKGSSNFAAKEICESAKEIDIGKAEIIDTTSADERLQPASGVDLNFGVELEALKAEFKRLEAEMEVASAREEEQKKYVEELEKKLEEAKLEREEMGELREKLEREEGEWEKERERLNSEMEKMKSTMEEMKIMMFDREGEKQAIELSLEERKRLMDESKTEIETHHKMMEAEADRLREEAEKLRAELVVVESEMERRVGDWEMKVAENENESSSLNARLEETRRLLATANEDRDVVRGKLDAANDALERAEIQHREAVEAKRLVDEELARKDAEVRGSVVEAERIAESLAEELSDAKTATERLRETLEESEGRNREDERLIRILREEASRFGRELEAEREAKQEAKRIVEELKEELEKTTNELRDSGGIVDDLRKQLTAKEGRLVKALKDFEDVVERMGKQEEETKKLSEEEEKLRSRNAELIEEKLNLQAETSASNETSGGLKAENVDLTNDLTEARMKISDLEAEVETKERDVERMRGFLSEVEVKWGQEVEELRKEKEEVERGLLVQQDSVRDVEMKNEELRGRSEEMEKEIERLEEQLVSLKANHEAELLKMDAEIESKEKDATKESLTLKTDLENLQERIKDEEMKRLTWEEKSMELEEKLRNYEEKVKEIERSADDLMTERDALLEEVKSVREQVAAADDELREVRESKRTLGESLVKDEEIRKKLEDEREELKAESILYREKLSQISQELEESKYDLNEVKIEKEKLKEEKILKETSLKEELNRLKLELLDSSQKLVESQTTLEEDKKKKEALKDEVRLKSENVSVISQKLEETRSSLSELKKSQEEILMSIERERDDLIEELRKVKDDFSNVQRDLQAANSQLESEREEILSAREKQKSLEEELQKSRNDFERIVEELEESRASLTQLENNNEIAMSTITAEREFLKEELNKLKMISSAKSSFSDSDEFHPFSDESLDSSVIDAREERETEAEESLSPADGFNESSFVDEQLQSSKTESSSTIIDETLHSLKTKLEEAEYELLRRNEETESIRDNMNGLSRRFHAQRQLLVEREEEMESLKSELAARAEVEATLQSRIEDLVAESDAFKAWAERRRRSRESITSDEEAPLPAVVEEDEEEEQEEEEEVFSDLNEVVVAKPAREDRPVDLVSPAVNLVTDENLVENEKATVDVQLRSDSNTPAAPASPSNVDELLRENSRLRAEVEELRRGNKNSVDEESSALLPISSSPLSNKNAALLDSYILSQSPVFYFLAQHLESAEVPEFGHRWRVGAGENALNVSATWEPPPGGGDDVDAEIAAALAAASPLRKASASFAGASPASPTPSNLSSTSFASSSASKSRSSWTITPLLLPKDKIDKKSARARLRQRHLQRLRTRLASSSSSTSSLPALTLSSLRSSANVSAEDISRLPTTPGGGGESTPARRALLSPAFSEVGAPADMDDLRGVVAGQMAAGKDLKGKLNSSFAAVIQLQESIYLLRRKVNKRSMKGAEGGGDVKEE